MNYLPLIEEIERLRKAGDRDIFIRANNDTGLMIANDFMIGRLDHKSLHVRIVFDPKVPEGKVIVSNGDKYAQYCTDTGLNLTDITYMATFSPVYKEYSVQCSGSKPDYAILATPNWTQAEEDAFKQAVYEKSRLEQHAETVFKNYKVECTGPKPKYVIISVAEQNKDGSTGPASFGIVPADYYTKPLNGHKRWTQAEEDLFQRYVKPLGGA